MGETIICVWPSCPCTAKGQCETGRRAIARHLAPGDDLVERLLARKGRGGGFKHTVEDGVNVLTHEPAPDPLCQEAAARLSALTAERDELRDMLERAQHVVPDLYEKWHDKASTILKGSSRG